MLEPEFLAYCIALISFAVSLYALVELHEAKEYGRQWMKLTRDLQSRINDLEKRKR